MKALILYSSLSGNTKKIANSICEEIPFDKEIHSIDEDYNIEKFDLVIAGYWVNKGTCDNKVKEMLEKLQNKRVILFGTSGAKDSGEYYEGIKKRVEGLVPVNNHLLGHFLCQGKINEKLTERYKEMLKKNPDDEHIKHQLDNHKEASTHPDTNDIKMAKLFIDNIINDLR